MPTRELFHKVKVSESPEDLNFVLSDDTIDRIGDVMNPEGVSMTAFRKNPIALFNHDQNQVLGTWKAPKVVGRKLVATLSLADPGTSPLVDQVRSLVKQKILRAVSIGYLPTRMEPNKSGGYNIHEWELLEASIVSVPCNPSALALAKSLNVSPATLRLIFSDSAIEMGAKASGESAGDLAGIPRPRIEAVRKRLNLSSGA